MNKPNERDGQMNKQNDKQTPRRPTYEVRNTGGGCRAYEKETALGNIMWFTDLSGCHLPTVGEEAFAGIHIDIDGFLEEFSVHRIRWTQAIQDRVTGKAADKDTKLKVKPIVCEALCAFCEKHDGCGLVRRNIQCEDFELWTKLDKHPNPTTADGVPIQGETLADRISEAGTITAEELEHLDYQKIKTIDDLHAVINLVYEMADHAELSVPDAKAELFSICNAYVRSCRPNMPTAYDEIKTKHDKLIERIRDELAASLRLHARNFGKAERQAYFGGQVNVLGAILHAVETDTL